MGWLETFSLLQAAAQAPALARSHPWLGPAAFVIGLLGMLWRGRALSTTHSASSVDFDRLRKTDFKGAVPWIKKNLRGHDAIVDGLGEALEENLELAKPGKTLGAFLLAGPTGTGKTFLAQLAAEALFPGSEPLVLRMNQYKSPDDVFTLIGPPPGVRGFELGGALTRPVLDNPYRVIVLDELEKCHRDIQDCLYDILDAGLCREKSSGRLVSFAACVFFGTCNAGVEGLRAAREQAKDDAAWLGKSRDVLSQSGFAKAFLARWDRIFFMDELEPLQVAEVACLKLVKRWREYGIELAHADPSMILDAVQKNEEFREYGVRQLGAYLDSKTNGAIAEAKRKGYTKINLDIGASGEVRVSPAAPA